MKLFHGSKEVVIKPEVREGLFYKDFSWGFYCTKLEDQAKRWARRGTGSGVVNFYDFEKTEDLKLLHFPEMSDEWLDFIAHCRSGGLHDYDVVEGPMANDSVWNYVNDFINGTITRRQFWVLAEFKHPIHQISFHTSKGLTALRFEKSEVVL